MIKFNASIALIFVSLALGIVAQAQPTRKVFRVGLLSDLGSSPMPLTIDAFRQGLRELGYIEAKY